MGVMNIQIAPAVEAEQILSGEQCIGFSAEDHGLNVLNSAE
jgi:hypothetical protein